MFKKPKPTHHWSTIFNSIKTLPNPSALQTGQIQNLPTP